jgi:PAS domain S-box-containing protein
VLKRSNELLKRPSIPWIILGVTLLLTLIAAGSVAENTHSRFTERFANATESTVTRIEDRLHTYVTLMSSGVGLYAATGEVVTRQTFHQFVRKIDLPRHYPGLQGFGFTERVLPSREDSLREAMVRQGFEAFSFWPELDGGERHAIVFLEPLDRRNEAAIGFNMYLEVTRQAAMQRARDRAEPALSGRVTLVQEIEGRRQSGFLIYLPVFRGGSIPPTLASRTERLVGFIYAPFRADDLFMGIFRSEERPRLAFRIYDGPAIDPESLLHDSRAAGIAPASGADYDYKTSITMYGRTWTIAFAPTPMFAAESQSGAAFSIGVLGVILALVLFALSRQQVLAEQRARTNEARLQAIVESVPVGMVVSDAIGRVSFANTAHRRLHGHRVSAQLRDIDLDTTAIEGDIRLMMSGGAEMINRALRGTPTLGVVLELHAEDGQRRTTLNSYTPIYSPEGSVEMVVVAEVDITEQRRAEAALRERERELQTMVDAIPQLAWMADPDGSVIWFNRRWLDYTGVVAGEMYGWSWLERVHPDDRGHVDELLRRTIEKGSEWEDTMRIADRGGQYREFLARAVPIRDESGGVIRWFGTSTDITDELAARDAESRAEREQIARQAAEMREEQLRLHASELERSNRELQDFAYVASHDLQEPLRKISTFTDLVIEEYGGQLDDEASLYLKRVQRAALRMSRLIKDLLSFSRVTSRAKPFAKVDLNDVISEVISDLEVLIKDTGGEVAVESLPTIDADPVQMRQLFQNLIGNSLKFHRDGEAPNIAVRDISEAPSHAAVEISDNGIGFDEKYLDRIFTPFQRLHGANEYGGTGIGLAICRRIVERHQGRITARSQVGVGSTFIVELPVVNRSSEPSIVAETMTSAGVESPG